MDSIIFLIALVCVIYVIYWAIRNEEIKDNEPTEGLFKMNHEADEAEKPGD